jgi:hypothetical protein
MTEGTPATLESMNAAAYPALAQFARGYLHQDAPVEYGTFTQAFRTFWSDADRDEQERFLLEWRAFLSLSDRRAWPDVRHALERLGAAWIPPTRRALGGLRRAIGRSMRVS